MVLAAPVDPGVSSAGDEGYVVAFHLDDGTATVRSFWPETGELWPDIMLPPTFGQMMDAAVAAGRGTPTAGGTPVTSETRAVGTPPSI
jgi:hypothetical protein